MIRLVALVDEHVQRVGVVVDEVGRPSLLTSAAMTVPFPARKESGVKVPSAWPS